MSVTPSARDHLFDAISRQYDPEDAETLKVLLMSMHTTDLATKQDLADLRAATKQDLADLRAELKGDFAELKDDFVGLNGDFAGLKGDFAELRVEFADFRAEMHQALYQQTRTYITWMFGLLTAYTAMSGSLVAIATIIISR